MELHFNNHISGEESKEEFALRLFNAIMDCKDGFIELTVDDGDGDLWKHYIDITTHLVEPHDPYLGDGNFADNH